jgi:hypothetical protein
MIINIDNTELIYDVWLFFIMLIVFYNTLLLYQTNKQLKKIDGIFANIKLLIEKQK